MIAQQEEAFVGASENPLGQEALVPSPGTCTSAGAATKLEQRRTWLLAESLIISYQHPTPIPPALLLLNLGDYRPHLHTAAGKGAAWRPRASPSPCKADTTVPDEAQDCTRTWYLLCAFIADTRVVDFRFINVVFFPSLRKK